MTHLRGCSKRQPFQGRRKRRSARALIVSFLWSILKQKWNLRENIGSVEKEPVRFSFVFSRENRIRRRRRRRRRGAHRLFRRLVTVICVEDVWSRFIFRIARSYSKLILFSQSNIG